MTDDETYEILEFGPDEPRETEPMGTKTKYWVRRDDAKWLFKKGRAGTGEHWAEKAARELARLLDVPAAEVKLAVSREDDDLIRGTASKNFVPEDAELVHGNELLAKYLDDYDRDKRYEQNRHRVDHVFDILEHEVDESAARIFAGYLVLDGWIANVDRHHENWAVLRSPDGNRLAPSYDHASSLGRLLDDDDRIRMLEEQGRASVEKFLTRSDAEGAIYPSDGAGQVPPYALLSDTCSRGYRPKIESVLDRLRQLDERDIEVVFERFPSDWISDTAVDFARRMLETTEGLMRDTLEAP